MGVTINGEGEAVVSVDQPTAESFKLLAKSGKRSTKPELTQSERLEILQQSLLDLAHTGIQVEVSEIHEAGETYVGIVLYKVRYDGRRLVAINGKGAK